MKPSVLFVLFITLVVLAGFLFWPDIDLKVAQLFYTPQAGFSLAEHPLFVGLHNLSYYGARFLGVVLAVLGLIAVLRCKPITNINAKGWLFLFLALMIGPVLIANVVLKDHWGRARPREIVAFGGDAAFSPAWIPQAHGHKNGSFVAGDPAFGFYLTSFAYLLPLPQKKKKRDRSRSLFWAGMSVGAILGFARIAMGAHFVSDVFFAAFFMLASGAALHAVMYGRAATAMAWRHWLFIDSKNVVTQG